MAQTFLNLAQGVTGTLPNANFSGGKVLQVVSTNYVTTATTNSSTYSDTGLTLNITPSATSSKILVFPSMNGLYNNNGDTNADFELNRSGGASGDGGILTFSSTAMFDADLKAVGGETVSCTHLDTPAVSGSALTYKVQFRSSNNSHSVHINTYIRGDARGRCTLTLMEIGA